MRTLLACLVVPLVAVMGLIGFDMLGLNHVGTGPSVAFSLVIYVFAFAITVVVALPIRHAARRWHFSTLPVTTILGFITGVVVARITALVVISHLTKLPIESFPASTDIKSGMLGAFCAFVFWLIARPELRPNMSPQRPRAR